MTTPDNPFCTSLHCILLYMYTCGWAVQAHTCSCMVYTYSYETILCILIAPCWADHYFAWLPSPTARTSFPLPHSLHFLAQQVFSHRCCASYTKGNALRVIPPPPPPLNRRAASLYSLKDIALQVCLKPANELFLGVQSLVLIKVCARGS